MRLYRVDASRATHVRGLHPYHFRAGKWAQITKTYPDSEGVHHYVVCFPDGMTDCWAASDRDPDDRYEFGRWTKAR